jgi:ATP-binding cassette subfamily B protein
MTERRQLLRSLWYMTTLAFRADPWRAAIALVMSAVQTSGHAAAAWAVSRLVAAAAAGDGDATITWAAAIAAIALATLVASLTRLDLRFRMEESTAMLIDQELIGLTTGVPGLEQHERPEHLDRLELLRQQRRSLGGSVGALIENVGVFAAIISTTALLASVDPRLLVLPAFGVPSIMASGWHRRLQRKLEDDVAEDIRRAKHLFELGTTGPPAKELRVFGLRDVVRDRHGALNADVDHAYDSLTTRVTVVSTLAWAVFAIAYVGSLAFVVREAVQGRASTADVVLVATLAAQVNQQVGGLYWMVGWLFDTLKTVGRYLRLSDDAAAARRPVADPLAVPDRLTDGIRFDDVGFTYPGTDTPVLDGVDLHLPAGATVAVVGDNGAGKSTLMKLLCGFYRPTTGAVLVDGADLARMPVEAWRERVSAGFQDFARLELIARETVGVGSLAQMDDAEFVGGALERAAAADVVLALTNGLDTQVGRLFDGGMELSGGQWQKLALGRAMMRERPLLLVLDEPTAALDADTEHALFQRYAGAARAVAQETGGITVLVSHRFSTVRMADLIVVVGNGTIVECGTHDQLMSHAGTYAELYELQARAYR